MPADRFFYPHPLQAGATISLDGDEFHHCIHVMRLKAGDLCEIVNGQGQLAQAALTQIAKKGALFCLNEVHTQKPKDERLILAQGMPRLNRLDIIVEKATELGATDIWLFGKETSGRSSLTPHQQERMQTMMAAALKQCGRLFMPSLKIFSSLIELVNAAKELNIPSFFGDVSPSAPFLAHEMATRGDIFSVLVYIGREEGFDANEIELLQKSGAKGIKLHANILRSETAAIAALALLSQGL